MKKIFKREQIIALRPAEWPCAQYPQYLAPDQAPYLSQILAKAKTEGYTKEQLASAWGWLLSHKSNNILPDGDELDLTEALCVLFEPLSYYEIKRHYVAYATAVEK